MNDRYRLLLSPASAGYAAVCFTVTSCVGTNHFPELFNPVCGNGVMHPFSLFVVINKAVVCKDLHVMRKGRLRDIQFLQQITSTLFSMLERKYDRKAIFICERLYFFSILSQPHDFHLQEMYLFFPHINSCQYVSIILCHEAPRNWWQCVSHFLTSISQSQLPDV